MRYLRPEALTEIELQEGCVTDPEILRQRADEVSGLMPYLLDKLVSEGIVGEFQYAAAILALSDGEVELAFDTDGIYVGGGEIVSRLPDKSSSPALEQPQLS